MLMYVCQLKDAKSAKDPRQLLAQGRGAGLSISEEEKSTLEKDIKEQEVLLQGYQKVRERGSGERWEVLYKINCCLQLVSSSKSKGVPTPQKRGGEGM